MIVVCPPQRDLGLFLMSFESPCGGLSPYLSCIEPEVTSHNLFKLSFDLN